MLDLGNVTPRNAPHNQTFPPADGAKKKIQLITKFRLHGRINVITKKNKKKKTSIECLFRYFTLDLSGGLTDISLTSP